MEALGSALVSGVAPGLKVMLLTANNFGDAGLQSFATLIANGMAPKLQMVELSGNNFGDAGAKALADALRQRLASGECKLGINFLFVGNHVGSRGLRCQRVCCYGTRSALESGRQQIISASRAHKRSSSGSTAAKDERHRALQVGFDSVRDLRIVCFHRTTGSISLPRT
jgi:hypothetical protein